MSSIPHYPQVVTGHPDAERVVELQRAVESTYRVLRHAVSAYEMATRDSAHDNLDDDPQVIATRELRDLAQRSHDAAADRLDEVLTFAPIRLDKDDVTPQSRRSLEAWTRSRGAGEELTTAVRQVLAALAGGRVVTITVE